MTVNHVKAKECFEIAAAQGHAGAMYELGRIYEKGYGVETDVAQALRWYEEGAKLGDIDAMEALSLIHI